MRRCQAKPRYGGERGYIIHIRIQHTHIHAYIYILYIYKYAYLPPCNLCLFAALGLQIPVCPSAMNGSGVELSLACGESAPLLCAQPQTFAAHGTRRRSGRQPKATKQMRRPHSLVDFLHHDSRLLHRTSCLPVGIEQHNVHGLYRFSQ